MEITGHAARPDRAGTPVRRQRRDVRGPGLQGAYDDLDAGRQSGAPRHPGGGAGGDGRAVAVAGRDPVPPVARHRSAGAGAAALLAAIEHCVLMGFYDAVIELGGSA